MKQSIKCILMTLTALSFFAMGLATPFLERWEGKRYLFFYMTPIVLYFYWWLYHRLRIWEKSKVSILWLDSFIVLFSVARLAGVFPFSGHVLFYIYAVLTTKNRLFKIVGFLLLLKTSWFKIVLWGDWDSWGWGIGVALAMSLLYHHMQKKEE